MKEEKTIYNLLEIFTPSQPADITFVERNEINRRLERALKTPGKQIILYGYSGVGKTTLLTNKLKESQIKYIKTNCITGMTINDIILDAFNQLDVYYPIEKSKSKSDSGSFDLNISFWLIKAGIKDESKSETKISHKRAVELPITPQNLAKYIGAKNLCWVIEDFHKIEESHKKQMAQIMKVFMDSSTDYNKLKIVALGAVNSAREVVQYDPEMRNRIAELEVPLMDIQNLKRIISNGEKYLNIEFDDAIKNRISTYSSGLPAVTHNLCLLMCELNNIKETQSIKKSILSNTFNEAMEEFLEESSDSFKIIYEHATKIIHKRKNENPLDLLNAIIQVDKENFSILEVKEIIQVIDPSYIGNNLKKYMDEFCSPLRSEVLRFNENSNRYYFSNPFIKAYIQCVLKKDVNITNSSFKSEDFREEFKNILKIELNLAKKAFILDFGDEFSDIEDF
ncbi:EutP/PduV family microcompartment system protein [Chryseobacterium sp. JJR-5R]|uniref:EutP/PduV family microcompartment system protein n=1 Tax=Chryseobacterium sp. JJR-5R TaxID=3093923 RepID=UPI002A7521D7|nr:EutP/PduV family microcompartment system protein [Chryseobacterium sp. JJR-5R]WPO82248.1 EutP/PduV family microcompartment system protein [Chryseobacterium sp. JJR-5R]